VLALRFRAAAANWAQRFMVTELGAATDAVIVPIQGGRMALAAVSVGKAKRGRQRR
jgi:hypothetical protein